MRDIWFRGKRLDNKDWVYGYYFSSDEMPKRGEIGHFIKCGLNAEFIVDPSTVGQCTGLTDKNGTEIYEGDVINVLPDIDDSFSYRVIGKHVIEWWSGQFVFKANSTREDDYINFGWWVRSNGNRPQLKQVEIIGTIHDNPNLLESEG